MKSRWRRIGCELLKRQKLLPSEQMVTNGYILTQMASEKQAGLPNYNNNARNESEQYVASKYDADHLCKPNLKTKNDPGIINMAAYILYKYLAFVLVESFPP